MVGGVSYGSGAAALATVLVTPARPRFRLTLPPDRTPGRESSPTRGKKERARCRRKGRSVRTVTTRRVVGERRRAEKKDVEKFKSSPARKNPRPARSRPGVRCSG